MLEDDEDRQPIFIEDEGVYVGLVFDATEGETWYVWRRSDSLVGVTNIPPEEAFVDDEEYEYHTLIFTSSYDRAHIEAVLARSAN